MLVVVCEPSGGEIRNAPLKVLYLVAQQQRPGRTNLPGQINGWKHILDAFTMHHGDRVAVNETTDNRHDR